MTYIDDDELQRNWLWLALDRLGCVGVFQSFGEGALPPSIRDSLEDAETVDDFVITTLKHQSANCFGHICRENEKLTSFSRFPKGKYEKDYQIYLAGVARLASCGVFVYDAHLQSQGPVGYFQIGYPASPRTLASLPVSIQNIVRRTVASITFFDTPYLSVEMIEKIVGAVVE